jgi:chromosome partitioning protein
MATVIVFGNEKGGTGKSTLAVHVAIALVRMNFAVTVVDGDLGQGSTTRYLMNRETFLQSNPHAHLAMPRTRLAHAWEDASPDEVAGHLSGAETDVIVVDTPGFHSPLSHALHTCADLIVTPLNDSLIDLAVLADIEPDTGEVLRPSHYAERVWQARKARAARDGGSISWVVLRNRLSALDAHNKRLMAEILDRLAPRVGFKVGPGFGERVIFRELFLQGLTLSDFEDRAVGLAWTVSHVAARQELRGLLDMIGTGLERSFSGAQSGATKGT